jgi:hypothetical protein
MEGRLNMSRIALTKHLRTAVVLMTWAFMAPAQADLVWNSGLVIAKLQTRTDGSFAVAFTTSLAACQNANSPKLHTVEVGAQAVTAEGLRGMYATALAALMTAKTVRVRWEDGGVECFIRTIEVFN